MKPRAIVQRIPKVAWALIAAQLVLLVILLLSLAQLMRVGKVETLRANTTQQRVLIDARTGTVSGLRATQEEQAEVAVGFDVAPDEEEVTETPAPETDNAEMETPPAEETKSDTPVEEVTETPAPVQETQKASPVEEPATQQQAEQEPLATEETLEEIAGSIVNAPIPAVESIARSNQSLVSSPAPEVTETKGKLVLPKRGEKKNVTPSKLYARGFVWPSEDDQKKPTIVLMVTGLGLSASAMQAALDLPAEVTLSFSPYLGKNTSWASFARNRGHEVWSDLPAQTKDFPATDPGIYGIFSKQPPEQTIERLHQAMAQISGFVGMSLPIDQQVLSDTALMTPVLKELESRGLLLVIPSSEAQLTSLAHLAPFKKMLIVADSVIDSAPNEASIRSQLSKLESIAQEKGVAFGVISASPLSLRMLASWAKTATKNGMALAPVSALPSAPKGS